MKSLLFIRPSKLRHRVGKICQRVGKFLHPHEKLRHPRDKLRPPREKLRPPREKLRHPREGGDPASHGLWWLVRSGIPAYAGMTDVGSLMTNVEFLT